MKLPVTRTSFGPHLRCGRKLSRCLRGPAGLNFPVVVNTPSLVGMFVLTEKLQPLRGYLSFWPWPLVMHLMLARSQAAEVKFGLRWRESGAWKAQHGPNPINTKERLMLQRIKLKNYASCKRLLVNYFALCVEVQSGAL